jgi:hypothetical protein
MSRHFHTHKESHVYRQVHKWTQVSAFCLADVRNLLSTRPMLDPIVQAVNVFLTILCSGSLRSVDSYAGSSTQLLLTLWLELLNKVVVGVTRAAAPDPEIRTTKTHGPACIRGRTCRGDRSLRFTALPAPSRRWYWTCCTIVNATISRWLMRSCTMWFRAYEGCRLGWSELFTRRYRFSSRLARSLVIDSSTILSQWPWNFGRSLEAVRDFEINKSSKKAYFNTYHNNETCGSSPWQFMNAMKASTSITRRSFCLVATAAGFLNQSMNDLLR